ncbi:MAG: adenosyl-hopene transferase HpnH [Candidatus Dormibacteraeota bacterium]|nr:adenosyl-hopene transferase HpnH [Candidatus Dormibacteraeota bacterium]MBV9526395.1 adenosyl-hopene transferase HpnH [Candidatus Dormibacteraeota bacterium]
MAVPLRQAVKVGAYVARQRLRKNDKFALVLQLEPLYQCNLACAGCGKIQHPDEILSRRLTVQQCVDAVEECGAPMVSIAGGEPLVHKEIDKIVQALVERKRFVYLCTNAILMQKKLDMFTPSPYFSFSVHIDGLRERHDESVCREGVFDKAVAAIREAKRRGFRVTTNTTFFDLDNASSIRDVLDFLNDEVGVDTMQISPGYAYEKAPDQEHWLSVQRTRQLFAEAFADGRRKKWRLNHSPLFLDFLEGKVDYACTAWGIPSYSVLGWQRPCYLMSDGYVASYKALVETTDWDSYGRGRNEKCAQCMAHCGYEPTAIIATASSLRESLRAAKETVRGQFNRPTMPAA